MFVDILDTQPNFDQSYSYRIQFEYDNDLQNFIKLKRNISARNTLIVLDLDGTITKDEILPIIAERFDKGKLMHELTQKAILGLTNYEKSLKERIRIIGGRDIKQIAKLVSETRVSPHLKKFIDQNPDNVIILSANIDCWINSLVEKLNANYISSRGILCGDEIKTIKLFPDKGWVIEQLRHLYSSNRIVAVGDGHNDIPMLEKADVSIAYSGTHFANSKLQSIADHCINDEEELCTFLKQQL